MFTSVCSSPGAAKTSTDVRDCVHCRNTDSLQHLSAPSRHSMERLAAHQTKQLPASKLLAWRSSTSALQTSVPNYCMVSAASALSAALLLMQPGPVCAQDVVPSTTALQDNQALSLLLPAGSLATNLSTPEAPALVSNSGEVLLEGVKSIVESGLQDLAANSMTAVGGPVTSEVLSASINQATAESLPTSGNLMQQQPSSPAGSMPASTAPHQQQGQQQHQQQPVWCTAWQAYCDALERSPLPTKVYTGVLGTLLGDLVAQVLSHSRQQQPQARGHRRQSVFASNNRHTQPGFKFDALRAGRLCLYSAAIGTPMGHYWYALLESAVLPATPLAPAAVTAKVALDQLVQTPIGMALFFAIMKLLEGKPRQVQPELHSKMFPALLANWRLWPLAQLVNFTMIPEEQRTLYTNIIGICWTCVISNMQQEVASSKQQSGRDASLAASPASSSHSRISRQVPVRLPVNTMRRRSSSSYA